MRAGAFARKSHTRHPGSSVTKEFCLEAAHGSLLLYLHTGSRRERREWKGDDERNISSSRPGLWHSNAPLWITSRRKCTSTFPLKEREKKNIKHKKKHIKSHSLHLLHHTFMHIHGLYTWHGAIVLSTIIICRTTGIVTLLTSNLHLNYSLASLFYFLILYCTF